MFLISTRKDKCYHFYLLHHLNSILNSRGLKVFPKQIWYFLLSWMRVLNPQLV